MLAAIVSTLCLFLGAPKLSGCSRCPVLSGSRSRGVTSAGYSAGEVMPMLECFQLILCSHLAP